MPWGWKGGKSNSGVYDNVPAPPSASTSCSPLFRFLKFGVDDVTPRIRLLYERDSYSLIPTLFPFSPASGEASSSNSTSAP